MDKTNLFVTCGPLLEGPLMDELRSLGFSKLKQGCRGVYVDDATITDCYRINYCSRIATRVLWPLIRFRCPNRDALYNNARQVPWEKIVSQRATIAIDSNVSGNTQLRNSHFAGLVIKDAVCDSLRELRGTRPNVDVENPDVQLNLYVAGGAATLSLDTSGKPLHKRGYRQEGGEAPLQENLAAAILMLIGYQGTGVLCDPLCGSGTFLIEAALIATKTMPGYLRQRWGFQSHPHFRQEEWLRTKNTEDQQRQPLPQGLLYGVDSKNTVLEGCRKNLRAAGFLKEVALQHGDFDQLLPTLNTEWVVTNPPYGTRLGKPANVASVYRQLGEAIKRCKSSSLVFGILLPETSASSSLDLPVKKVISLSNGGIPIHLVQGMLK